MSSSLCSFHQYHVNSSLTGPNVFLSALFSNSDFDVMFLIATFVLKNVPTLNFDALYLFVMF